MTAVGWSRVGPLLDELLSLDGAARGTRLAELRREAPAVAAELEALLRADASAGGLLDQGLPVPSSSGVTALPDLTGERAGPYRLTHLLGLGGMGVVYAAERADGSYRQSVAVKIVPEASSALGRRFLRERAILAALDHPGIARLLDAGTLSSGQPFFVMERIEGATLLEHCDGARADVDSRCASFSRSATPWPSRTSDSSCTGTSSRPTSSCSPTGRRSCSTSASPRCSRRSRRKAGSL